MALKMIPRKSYMRRWLNYKTSNFCFSQSKELYWTRSIDVKLIDFIYLMVFFLSLFLQLLLLLPFDQIFDTKNSLEAVFSNAIYIARRWAAWMTFFILSRGTFFHSFLYIIYIDIVLVCLIERCARVWSVCVLYSNSKL